MKKLTLLALVTALSWLLTSCSHGDMQLLTADSTVPIESVQLSAPLIEVSADDHSFILTGNKSDGAPFYSNEDGPMVLKQLQKPKGREYAGNTRAVRVKVEGYDMPLYGRLAIFPASNPKKYGISEMFLPERFNLKITLTPESLAQMKKEGIGLSCTPYYRTMHDWCDWALWISKSPIP